MDKIPKTLFSLIGRVSLLALLVLEANFTAYAGPHITAISPDWGPRVGNTTITIAGEGFSPNDKVVLWGGGPYIKGAHSTIGSANALYCSGSYAYLACGVDTDPNGRGVCIFGIQDLANPQLIGFFPLPKKATDIFVFGNYAYVAAGEAGLQILDIHNPSSPSLVTYRLVPGKALKIFVYADYIYIASDYGGLQIVDISDPEHPELVGSCPIDSNGYALDVFVEGDYAYVAAGWGGVKILDVSNPSNPETISSFSPQQFVISVYKYQNHLYLSEMENGVDILDVSDPQSPEFISNFDTPGLARNVSIKGDHLYVSDDYCGIEIFDSDPNNFGIVGFQATPGWATDLQVSNDHIFVADALGGFQIIDAYYPRNPSIVSIMDLLNNATGVQVNGLYLDEGPFENHAYIFSRSYSSEQKWLKILDVSNPKIPRLCGNTQDIGSKPEDMIVTQGYAFLVDGDHGLQVFNVTDKRNPQRIPFIDSDTSGGKGISMRDSILFLADTTADEKPALKIFSHDLKMFPSLEGEGILSNPDASAEAICLMENYAILAAGAAGVKAFAIQTPYQPFSLNIDFQVTGFINDVLISQPYLCVTSKEGFLQTFDISNIADPVTAGLCGIAGDPRSISSTGNHLYVAEGRDGLQVAEVGELGDLLITASMPTLTPAEDIVADGEGKYIYVAIENGLMVVDALKPCPSISYIESSGALEVITPPGLSPGTYHMTVTDPNGANTIYHNGFTVGENHCPFISPIGDIDAKAAIVGEKLEFSIDAYDEDDDPLTYSASLYKLPAGATLDGNIFSWTPGPEDTGFYPGIQFTVSDGECTYEREIIIFILDNIDNTAPILQPIGNKEVSEGTPLSLTLSAIDHEDDPLVFSVSSLPEGAVFEENLFFWTPGYNQSGIYTIRFTVREENSNLEDSEEIQIIVHNTNRAPVLSLRQSYNGTQRITVAFFIEATDPDPEDIASLQISMLNPPEGASLHKLTVQPDKMVDLFLWTPTHQQKGDYSITFAAKDHHLSEDQRTVSVHIQEVSGSSYTVDFSSGVNVWLSPEGQSEDYTSFDFLKELGPDTVYALHAYDWDATLRYSCFWFFGKPSGDDFPMNKSQIYIVYTLKGVSFDWP